MNHVFRSLLFPFLRVEWEREPKFRNPLVRVRCFGLIVDEREWNGLGNLWMTPRSLEEGLWQKILRRIRLVK